MYCAILPKEYGGDVVMMWVVVLNFYRVPDFVLILLDIIGVVN